MARTSVLIMILVLVGGGAVVHGAATHRWTILTPPPSRAESVHGTLLKLEAMTSEDVPSELPIKERSRVTCRRYNMPGDIGPIVVSITSGPPGAVATHTPDVCYPGSGYKTIRSPKKETVDLPGGGQAHYLVAVYEKKTSTSVDRQCIRWCWTADGQWDVPNAPRFHLPYLRASELFKLYIVTPVAVRDDERDPGDSPAVRSTVKDVLLQYTGLLNANR